MIRRISIDGFRSLVGFSIELEEGLNVLVGANGTGKSNFISFLDFLGEFIQSGLNSAIAVAQGTGAVFSREKFTDESAVLSFEVEGLALGSKAAGIFFSPEKNEILDIQYIYSCSLRYISSIPAVYVESEYLTLNYNDGGPLRFLRTTSLVEKAFLSKIEIEPVNHPALVKAFRWRKQTEKSFSVEEHLAEVQRPDASIIPSLFSELRAALVVMIDLIGYRSVNIDPSLARKPTTVGSTTELLPNGEGLAGTLYQLGRGSYHPFSMGRFYRPGLASDEQRLRFASIMSWCREVNPDIESVDVTLDFQEALLKPSVKFRFDEKPFGFNRISDGTVKWISLATMLLLGESSSVIEEPENFLHPFMQEVFIALCRQVMKSDGTRALIISTHSPTLLDCCGPKELRIFEIRDGKTFASRVANRTELAGKIANSRFGLGYYYKTGGVYGEDSGNGGGAHGGPLH
ncbi:MAG: hypothetical protein B7Y99_02470 [Caulobacterales bacterium 32-69-10]|nr:MAG: hypothetical protein B7Y99_02470 [Caulobacterales bacterium 32-69-10]